MVARNRRDDANLGRTNDISRVAPAPKAGLEHNDIAPLLGKVQKRQRCGELELTDVFALRQRQPLTGLRPRGDRRVRSASGIMTPSTRMRS